ncbi:MAG: hypothetical protein M0Q43_09185 [Methanothrix sp.]|nr:hypothetical protein [Methanothrix sp.]
MDNKPESIDDLLAMNLSNQTTQNHTALNYTTINSSDFNSSEFASKDLDFADNYYDSDFYSQIQSEPEVLSLAFPATDLNGDNATDLLVMNISSDADTGAFNSEIAALSGGDGSTLWQNEYPGSLVFATTAGDLDGDGQTDVMINEILAAGSFIPYSSVSALDGCNGTVIWSRSRLLAMTFAYPVKDTSGDNASEFMVHVFGMDSMNNSIFTRIARVSGCNGTNLDERIFSDALAIEYPAGNLTNDLVQDSIAASYQLNGSMTGEGVGEESHLNVTATIFEARDGQEHKMLWNHSFAGPAMAVPVIDLTGDGRDELVVYLMKYEQNGSLSCDIAVLRGSDGKLLWQQSFAGQVFVVAGPDLTGEGQRDLIVYRLGESESAKVLAVKGDDGRLLWSREGIIFIPS